MALAGAVDPSAVACASRREGEPWFVLEQPDRRRSALAALGAVVSLSAVGEDRFAGLARRWRELAADAVSEDVASGQEASPAPPGAGPLALGGFAFAPDGGGSPEWAGFEPASMIVPEVAVRRAGAGVDGAAGEPRVTLTLAALLAPDDTVAEKLARLEGRLAELRRAPAAAARSRSRRSAAWSRARWRPSTTRRRSRARPS